LYSEELEKLTKLKDLEPKKTYYTENVKLLMNKIVLHEKDDLIKLAEIKFSEKKIQNLYLINFVYD
jgi:hypothetical protein